MGLIFLGRENICIHDVEDGLDDLLVDRDSEDRAERRCDLQSRLLNTYHV